MQDFHYNYIKAEILLSNTDCFRYKFQTENFTKSVTKFCELMWLYNYDIDNSVADVELKYEDYKNIFFNNSYMRHEKNRI